MTATERLRQLLDERGVEWGRLVDSHGIIGTFWWDSNNDQCSALEGADDIPIGKLSVQANLTPEQAVEATLGRGTCHVAYKHPEYPCSNDEICSKCGASFYFIGEVNYCPNCGRRVIE